MTKDKNFWIWLAGFIDGEGCVSIQPQWTKKGYRTFLPKLAIGNTDKKVLMLILRNTYPEKTLLHHEQHKNPRAKTIYNINFTGEKAIVILEKVYPYLTVKKQQGKILKGWKLLHRSKKGNLPKIRLQEEKYKKIRLLNKRGKTDEDLQKLQRSSKRNKKRIKRNGHRS